MSWQFYDGFPCNWPGQLQELLKKSVELPSSMVLYIVATDDWELATFHSSCNLNGQLKIIIVVATDQEVVKKIWKINQKLSQVAKKQYIALT